MRSAAMALVAVGVVACGAGNPGPASAASTVNASTSNLSSVFNAAQPGDTILLAAGDYGKFAGGAKSGAVTLRPQAGAGVTMHPTFNGAANIVIDGMTLSGIDISGKSHDIRVTNSRFTDQAMVDGSSMANANITFDHDSFDGIDACANCYEGRLSVRGSGTAAANPIGFAVTNSHFGNAGQSDGVQIIGMATGVQIGPGNEFSGIKQGSYSRHVDSIQLYGSAKTQIVGNYFHDDDTIIMAPDGGDHENVSNNVMVGAGYVPAVQFGHHDGTTFAHNTIKNIDVNSYVSGPDPDPDRNVVLRDNVVVNGSLNASGCQNCTNDHNLFSVSGKSSGTNKLVGNPAFAGGGAPTTWAGWALANGSPGKGNASDGADRGINLSAVPPSSGSPGVGGGAAGGGTGTTTNPAAAPAPTAAVIPVSAPAANQAAALRARWTFRPAKPRVGTRIVLTAPKTKAGGRKCVWTLAKGITRRGCQIVVVYKKAGVKHISVRITDRSGAVVRGTRDITIVARKKHHR
jgi:hypothetical protein